jgi:hypothetical protein
MSRILVCLAVVLVVVIAIYFVSGSTVNHYCGNEMISNMLPTSPEVEFIEGQPDMNMVNADGMEMIPHGDLGMGEGFGVGPGLVGFGRGGSSLMV